MEKKTLRRKKVQRTELRDLELETGMMMLS